MRRSTGPAARQGDEQRRHRVRLLRALIGICRRIERLQVTADAREACRQVADTLAAELGSEQAGRRAEGR